MRICMEDVSFSYDEGFPILHDINLDLDEPGLVCIIGPNGVGKSTLIKCINKLLIPTSGDVMLNEKHISELKFKDLAKVLGYVPGTSEDFFPITVMEMVMMGRHPYQKWSNSDDDYEIACKTMVDMSIQHLALRNCDELSAGQRQRVSIAKGLAQEPGVLILDEPTSNLDVRHQMVVTGLLRDYARENNMIVLMISHDLNLSSRYADKIVVMSTPGKIYSVGTPVEVITEAMMRYVYGVNCQIVCVQGRPHVILLDAIPDEAMREMHSSKVSEE